MFLIGVMMNTILLIFQRAMARNGQYISRKEACFIISRYITHIPSAYRKDIYSGYLKEMQRQKLLKKVDRFKLQVINPEASGHIIIMPKIEKDWF